MTENESTQTDSTEENEWDRELSECPDCGGELNYIDLPDQYALNTMSRDVECEGCEFTATETWEIKKTTRTNAQEGVA